MKNLVDVHVRRGFNRKDRKKEEKIFKTNVRKRGRYGRGITLPSSTHSARAVDGRAGPAAFYNELPNSGKQS
jgi:hypothetical protein